MKLRKDNKSGYPGVCYEARCKKWRAYYDKDGKKYSLGYFQYKEDAIKKRQEYDAGIPNNNSQEGEK